MSGRRAGDAQRRRVDWFPDWPGFVRRVEREIISQQPRSTGAQTPVGFLAEGVVSALAAGRGLDGRAFAAVRPATALIATTDRAIYHALANRKFADRPEMRSDFGDWVADLPAWIQDLATLVLLRPEGAGGPQTLVFARPLGGETYAALFVRLDQVDRKGAQPAMANWVRTVEFETRQTLSDLIRLRGEW